MYAAVRTLALVLFLALLLGVAMAILLERGAAGPSNAVVAAFLLVAVLFAIPVITLLVWAFLRSAALRRLTAYARQLAAGRYDAPEPRSSFGDVTELSRSIDELHETLVRRREQHEYTVAVLGEILNGMGEGLLAIDHRRRVALANRKFGEMFGVIPVVGKPLLEVVRNATLVRAFDEALEGTPTVTRTTLYVEDEQRELEMRIFPMTQEAEVAAVALLIDVTRIAHLENVRRDFLADFSHEVRTPMAGIRAAVETLEARKLDPEQDRQVRRVIVRQLSRLERLLKDIAQLTEIEAGEVVLQKQPVDLKELLEEVSGDFSDRVDGASVTVEVSGASSLNAVDAERMHQVFANLLDNALKHAAGATSVRLVIEDLPGESVVRVADNGEGISVEDQERIFNRFYRGDPSRSQPRPGTGLGLAIVKHLVLLHGGTIEVASSPGRGATFEVRIPKE